MQKEIHRPQRVCMYCHRVIRLDGNPGYPVDSFHESYSKRKSHGCCNKCKPRLHLDLETE